MVCTIATGLYQSLFHVSPWQIVETLTFFHAEPLLTRHPYGRWPMGDGCSKHHNWSLTRIVPLRSIACSASLITTTLSASSICFCNHDYHHRRHSLSGLEYSYSSSDPVARVRSKLRRFCLFYILYNGPLLPFLPCSFCFHRFIITSIVSAIRPQSRKKRRVLHSLLSLCLLWRTGRAAAWNLVLCGLLVLSLASLTLPSWIMIFAGCSAIAAFSSSSSRMSAAPITKSTTMTILLTGNLPQIVLHLVRRSNLWTVMTTMMIPWTRSSHPIVLHQVRRSKLWTVMTTMMIPWTVNLLPIVLHQVRRSNLWTVMTTMMIPWTVNLLPIVLHQVSRSNLWTVATTTMIPWTGSPRPIVLHQVSRSSLWNVNDDAATECMDWQG